MVWDANKPLSVPNHPSLSPRGTLRTPDGTLSATRGTPSRRQPAAHARHRHYAERHLTETTTDAISAARPADLQAPLMRPKRGFDQTI